MKRIREFLSNYETQTLKEIVIHGCISGCVPDLIYYNDTVAFHDMYENEIWNMLYQDAEDQDITICEIIAQFRGKEHVGSMDQLKNMLCWYAIEKVAYIMLEEIDGEV